MIFIKRPEAPPFMTDPNGRWQRETADNIAHYTAGNTDLFKFEMYNNTAVKDELKKVFVKCAYCESSYGAVYDGDVEHFRPKGRVKEKNPQTPGYFWLANNWDNLFLACQHCNQRRKHILFGEESLEAYGKLDQFPLKLETKRLKKYTEKLSKEEPARLLLNPCIEDPSEHFEYEDKEGVIVPLTPMGEKSVEVYVLKRPYLVQERKKKMILLFRQIERVKRELERLDNENSATQKKEFDKELEDLLAFTKPDEEFAGMSRFFVKKFLVENGIN
jgi:5-methylcytosine-specific restriction endonuclease McrA